MNIEEKYNQLLRNTLNINDVEQHKHQIEIIAKASNKSILQVMDDFYDILFDDVKSKISEIIKIENPLKASKKKRDVIEFIYRFVGDKKEAESTYRYAIQLLEQPKVYTLAELGEKMKKEKYEWIVSEVLPLGVMEFMVGGAKVGKTTFSSYMLLCLVTGKPFLNRPTKPCNVLLLSNEEPYRMTYNRFTDGLRDIEIENPELWREIVETGRLRVSSGLDIVVHRKQIFQQAKAFDAKVIIIDSLRQSCYISEQDKEIIPALYTFAKECHTENISCIILHHATKNNVSTSNKESKNDIDAIMNSAGGLSGIQGTHDGAIYVRRVKDNPNSLVVNFIPRFTSGFEVTVERKVGEANKWWFDVIEDKSISEYERNLQIDILEHLHEKYNEWKQCVDAANELNEQIPSKVFGHTINELVALCEAGRGDIISATNYMLQNNAICVYNKNKEYIFHLPEDGVSWLDILIEQEQAIAEQDELIINQLMECTTYQQVQIIYRDISSKDKKRINSKFTEEQKVHIWGLKFPPPYKVGDNIIVLDENGEEKEHTVVLLRIKPPTKQTLEGEVIEIPHQWYFVVDIENNVYYKEEDIVN